MTHPLVDLQPVLKPLVKVQLNIFKEGELDEKVVCRKFRQTTQHGAMAGKTQSKEVKYYNLDVIISVGCRVKYFEPIRHKVTFENSFSKTAIKISFSFHNYHSVHIIIHLSVKGEYSETTIIISRKDYSYKEKET